MIERQGFAKLLPSSYRCNRLNDGPGNLKSFPGRHDDNSLLIFRAVAATRRVFNRISSRRQIARGGRSSLRASHALLV